VNVLLDTCVLSEVRRRQGHPAVKKVVASFAAEELFISVLSIAEIAKGVSLLDDGPHRHELTIWLRALELDHADRILPLDLEAAHIWGELTAAAHRAGTALPAVDGLIAATALRHGLRVMTRNVEDFRITGVLLLNPWEPVSG
jgi:predicted nucleic acid-binding protein